MSKGRLKQFITLTTIIKTYDGKIHKLTGSRTFPVLDKRLRSFLKFVKNAEAGSPYIAEFIEEKGSKTSNKGFKQKLVGAIKQIWNKNVIRQQLHKAHEVWQYPSAKYGIGYPKPQRTEIMGDMLVHPAHIEKLMMVMKSVSRPYAKAMYEFGPVISKSR